ncbi:hypothetical protein D3C73_1193160 [compost metagenome]
MLAIDAKTATAKLAQFIDGIDDPYFAHKVSEQFGELSGSILAMTAPRDAAKMRHDLAQHFSGLTAKYESPEANDARETLEAADSMDQSAFFNDIVRQAVNDTVGVRYGSFINNTDDYFAANEAERPVVEEKPKPKTSTNVTAITPEEEAILSKYDFSPKPKVEEGAGA